MLKIFLVFLMAISIAKAESSDGSDQCAADVSRYTAEGLKKRQSIFLETSKVFKKNLPSSLIDYGFLDQAELKDGTRVEYSVGGCAHFSYAFKFIGKAIKPIKRDQSKIQRAIKLLSQLKLSSDEHQKLLLESLQNAQQKHLKSGKNGDFVLSCGDAECLLTDKGDGEIAISYSFAL